MAPQGLMELWFPGLFLKGPSLGSNGIAGGGGGIS